MARPCRAEVSQQCSIFGLDDLLVGSLISGAASLIGGGQQASAARDAARAQQAGIDQQIALAEQTRNQNEALYAPDVAGGNRAQSYLDAITYGSSGGGNGGYGGATDWGQYLRQNGDVAAAYATLKHPGETPEQFAERHYQEFGAGEGREAPQMNYGGTGEDGALTREDALAGYYDSPLYAMADEDYAARSGLTDQAYADETGVYSAARDDLNGIAKNRYDETGRLIDRGFNDRLGYLTEDLGVRQGYTDAAINDRARLNDIQNQKAQDRISGMLGVSGQTGKAARAYADAAEENNLAYSDTVRGYRNQDYTPFATGRMGAYDTAYSDRGANTDQYYGDQADYGEAYYDSLAGATNRRSAGRRSDYDSRSAGRANAYGSYLDTLGDSVNAGRNARGAVANANTSYASTVGGAYGDSARNYADASRASSEAWATGVSGALNAAGGYFGAQSAKNPKLQTYGQIASYIPTTNTRYVEEPRSYYR